MAKNKKNKLKDYRKSLAVKQLQKIASKVNDLKETTEPMPIPGLDLPRKKFGSDIQNDEAFQIK